MAPTRIYVKSLLSMMRGTDIPVHALSHITGGGLLENIPRVLPNTLAAHIDLTSWQRPEVFNWLQAKGNVNETEMHRVLNCGIGMVIVVPADQAANAKAHLEAQGETVYQIGQIIHRQDEAVVLDHAQASHNA